MILGAGTPQSLSEQHLKLTGSHLLLIVQENKYVFRMHLKPNVVGPEVMNSCCKQEIATKHEEALPNSENSEAISEGGRLSFSGDF